MNDKTYWYRLCKKNILFLNYLCIFVTIMFLPSAVYGQQAKKPKKNRFQLTQTSFLDTKAKLEWSLQINTFPGSISWNNAVSYVRAMNTTRYGNHNDWRLPTREELLSLVDYARASGFNGSQGREIFIGLQHAGLKNIQDEHYWSQTDDLYNDRFAWAVDFRTGLPETIAKGLYEYVVIVRTVK